MPDRLVSANPLPRISLLTAGRDQPYALGLTKALTEAGCELDFIGSDELTPAGLPHQERIHYLNLRGDGQINVSLARKITRVLVYYGRLLKYAAVARPGIFHILWVNKLEWFDQTFLMAYYKVLGKKICFTAHNVNKAKRDGHDSWLNRLTLRIHYHLCDHIFVHTEKMKAELLADFNPPAGKVTVIPFGINNVLPVTGLTRAAARQRLGLGAADKVLLFFGNIAPYKGLEYLVAAFDQLAIRDTSYRLIIAGRPKGEAEYWAGLQQTMARSPARDRILQVIEYVPDAETELYFKAADVSVLPYVHIFQSGVLLLSYNFGVPVIAADVGSLREDIVEGRTGYVFEPKNAAELARTIQLYFNTASAADVETRRREIQEYAHEKFSWTKVAAMTTAVYAKLAGKS